jgi:hypothetical protein
MVVSGVSLVVSIYLEYIGNCIDPFPFPAVIGNLLRNLLDGESLSPILVVVVVHLGE